MKRILMCLLTMLIVMACAKKDKTCNPFGKWEVHEISVDGTCWPAGLDYWDDFTIRDTNNGTYEVDDQGDGGFRSLGGSFEGCSLDLIVTGQGQDLKYKIERWYNLSGENDEFVDGLSMFTITQAGVTCSNGFNALGVKWPE